MEHLKEKTTECLTNTLHSLELWDCMFIALTGKIHLEPQMALD